MSFSFSEVKKNENKFLREEKLVEDLSEKEMTTEVSESKEE